MKQAAYALPDTPDAREDFEWLKTEVKAAGGDASVFAAENVDAWADDALVEEFRRARQDLDEQRSWGRRTGVEACVERAATQGHTRQPALRRLLQYLRERLVADEKIDFFGSAGRDPRSHSAAPARGPQPAVPENSRHNPNQGTDAGRKATFQGRVWITRPRPGVDRMASAWLIRLFIDRQARFGFAADRESV